MMANPIQVNVPGNLGMVTTPKVNNKGKLIFN